MTGATGTGDAAVGETRLKRTVGVTLLFFFIVGDTLGAGIYTLAPWPRTSAECSGCRWSSPWCWPC